MGNSGANNYNIMTMTIKGKGQFLVGLVMGLTEMTMIVIVQWQKGYYN